MFRYKILVERRKTQWQKHFLPGIFIMMFSTCVLLSGCGMETINPMDKISDVDYTVVTKENVPEEVLREIDQRKAKEFRMTFRDGENLYICLGYGEKDRGGYSISVMELYEAQNGLYVQTELVVPEEEKPVDRVVPTYPYIVIKTEYREKPVVFL